VGQKITARLLAPFREHDLGHLFVGQAVEPMKTAAQIRIGDGFDVENQSIHAG
jgi:hypothetical protein